MHAFTGSGNARVKGALVSQCLVARCPIVHTFTGSESARVKVHVQAKSQLSCPCCSLAWRSANRFEVDDFAVHLV